MPNMHNKRDWKDRLMGMGIVFAIILVIVLVTALSFMTSTKQEIMGAIVLDVIFLICLLCYWSKK